MGQYKIRLVGNSLTLSDQNRKILDELDFIIFPNDVGCKKRHPNRVWWIVYSKNIPIGFAGLEITEKTGYLCRVGILKEYRGRGLQKRLIICREKYSKKSNILDIITYAHCSSIHSLNNLIQCGYLIYEPENHWAGTSKSETVYLFKRLSDR